MVEGTGLFHGKEFHSSAHRDADGGSAASHNGLPNGVNKLHRAFIIVSIFKFVY